MKPHIVPILMLGSRRWLCTGGGRTGIGIGFTPDHAYRDWQGSCLIYEDAKKYSESLLQPKRRRRFWGLA